MLPVAPPSPSAEGQEERRKKAPFFSLDEPRGGRQPQHPSKGAGGRCLDLRCSQPAVLWAASQARAEPRGAKKPPAHAKAGGACLADVGLFSTSSGGSQSSWLLSSPSSCRPFPSDGIRSPPAKCCFCKVLRGSSQAEPTALRGGCCW